MEIELLRIYSSKSASEGLFTRGAVGPRTTSFQAGAAIKRKNARIASRAIAESTVEVKNPVSINGESKGLLVFKDTVPPENMLS